MARNRGNVPGGLSEREAVRDRPGEQTRTIDAEPRSAQPRAGRAVAGDAQLDALVDETRARAELLEERSREITALEERTNELEQQLEEPGSGPDGADVEEARRELRISSGRLERARLDVDRIVAEQDGAAAEIDRLRPQLPPDKGAELEELMQRFDDVAARTPRPPSGGVATGDASAGAADTGGDTEAAEEGTIGENAEQPGDDETAPVRDRTDSDGDWLTDEAEQRLGTDASNPDTDGDGVLDPVEVYLGMDPTSFDEGMTDADGDYLPDGVAPTVGDRDGDGLTDPFEDAIGTDPDAPDTDLDGMSDSDEFGVGGDPLTPDAPVPEAEEELTVGTAPEQRPEPGEAGADGGFSLDDQAEFDEAVADGYTVVTFCADWCPHCRQMEGPAEDLHAEGWDVHRVRVQDADGAPVFFPEGVASPRAFPCTMVFGPGGEPIAAIYGYKDPESLREFVEAASDGLTREELGRFQEFDVEVFTEPGAEAVPASEVVAEEEAAEAGAEEDTFEEPAPALEPEPAPDAVAEPAPEPAPEDTFEEPVVEPEPEPEPVADTAPVLEAEPEPDPDADLEPAD